MRTGVLLTIWWICGMAWGQPQEKNPGLPTLLIRTNTLALLQNVKQSANLAMDIRLNPLISADLGLGWMLGSTLFARYQGESYQGPRYRAGIKYFLHSSGRMMTHLGAEVLYQDILHRKYRSVLRQGGQYAEQILDRRHVRTTGFYLRSGAHYFLGRNQRWFMELQVGLGYRLHEVWRSNPPDVEIIPPQRTFFTFEYPEGRCRALHLLMGLHIGYALLK